MDFLSTDKVSDLFPCLRGRGLGDSLLPQVLLPDSGRFDLNVFWPSPSPNIVHLFKVVPVIVSIGEIALMPSLHFCKSFGDISTSSASIFNRNVNDNIKQYLEKIPKPGRAMAKLQVKRSCMLYDSKDQGNFSI